MDYRVRVKAVLDPSGIQSQLNKVSKNLKMDLNKSVSKTATSGANKAINDAQKQAKQYQDTTKQIATVSNQTSKQVDSNWKGIKGSITSTNNELKYALKTQMTWGLASKVINTASNAFTGMYDAVKQVDDSLTEMKKVIPYEQISQMYEVSEKAAKSKGMSMYLDDIAERGKKVGLTLSDMTDATTEFIKSGYDVYSKDGGMSALDLAEIAAIYTNIADAEISTGRAAGFIISQMKVFKDVAQEPIYVLNALNEVSNTMAVSSSELQAAMQTAGSSLGTMGNSFAQTMGLVTAGIEVLRGEPNKVANGLRTIGININALAQESDEWVAANGKVRISLKDANGDIRNTYDIMKDLYYGIEGQSAAWNDLTKAERDAIGVQAAGKTRYNVFTAIMTNYESAIQAANTAQGQFGLGMSENASAIKENEEAMKSIQKHIDNLIAAWQDFSRKMLSSDWINAVLTVATQIVRFLGTDFGQLTVKITATATAIGLVLKGLNKIKNAVKGFKLVEALQYLWSGKVPDRMKGEQGGSGGDATTKRNTDATKRNTDALNRNTRAQKIGTTSRDKAIKKAGSGKSAKRGPTTITTTKSGKPTTQTKKLQKGTTYTATNIRRLDKAAKATKNVTTETSKLGGTLSKVAGKFKGFLSVLGINPWVLLAGAVVGLGVYLYKTTDRFEDFTKAASKTKDEIKDLDAQIEQLENKKNKSKKEKEELKDLKTDRAVKKEKLKTESAAVTQSYKDKSGIGQVVTADYQKLLGNTTKAISEQEKALGEYGATARSVITLQQKANEETKENGKVSDKTAKDLAEQKKKLVDTATSLKDYYREMRSLKKEGQLPKELESTYNRLSQFMDEYTEAVEKGKKSSFDFNQALKNLNASQLKSFAKQFMNIDNMSFDQIRKRMTLLGKALEDTGKKGQDAFKKLIANVEGLSTTKSGKTVLDPKKMEEYAKQTDLTADAFKNLVNQQDKAGHIQWKFDAESLKGYTQYLSKLEEGSVKSKKGLTVSKDAMKKMGKQTGLTNSQLKTLEKQLKKSGTKVFDFHADTKKMNKQLKNLSSEIGAVADESGKIKTVNFEKLKETVYKLGGSDRDLGRIVKKISQIEGMQLTGKGAKQFVDSLQIGEAAVDKISGKYETLKKNSDQPLVMTFKADVDDTFYKVKGTMEELSARQWVAKMIGEDEASSKVDEVMGKLRTLEDEEWKAIITGEDNSAATVDEAKARLKKLIGPDWTARLYAEDKNATSIIQKVINKLAGVKDKSVKLTVTEVFNKVVNTVQKVFKKRAHGKRQGEAGGMAWLGDEGSKTNPKPELVKTKDGAYLAGTKGWELVELDKDDEVFSNQDTKRMLGDTQDVSEDFIPRFANGTLSYKDWKKQRDKEYKEYKKQVKQYRETVLKEKQQKEKEEKKRKKAEEKRKKEARRQARIAQQQRIAERKKDPNYNNPFYIPGAFPQGQDLSDNRYYDAYGRPKNNQSSANTSSRSNKSTPKSTSNRATPSSNNRSSGSSYTPQKTAAEKYKEQTDRLAEQFENQLKILEFNKDYNSWSEDTFNKKYKELFNEYNKRIKNVPKPSTVKNRASLGGDRYRDLQTTLRDTEKDKAKKNIEERIEKIGVMDNDAYVKKAIEYINKVRNERKISAEEAKEYSKDVYKTNFEYLLKEYEDGKVSYEKMQEVLQNYYNVAGKKTADYYNMQKDLQESTDARYQNTMDEQTELYLNDKLSYSQMEETLKDYYKKAGGYTKKYYELEKQMQEAATTKFQTEFDKRLDTYAEGESNYAAVYSVILGYINEIGSETEEAKQMMKDLKDATHAHAQARFDKQIKQYKKGNTEYTDIVRTLKQYHDDYGGYTEQYYEMLDELRDAAAEVYGEQLDKQIKLYEEGNWAYSNLRDVIKEYYKTVGGYTKEYYEMIDKAEEAALNKFQRQFDLNMDLYDAQRRSYKDMLIILRNYYLEVGHYTEEYYEMWEELAQKAKEQELDRLDELKEKQESRLDVGERYVNQQIDALDKEIDKLRELNEEEEKAAELQELQNDLAKAQAQRVHIYREDQGFVYERDIEAIYDAQKAIDDFKKEAELDKQVKALEDMKKKWQDILDKFEDSAATKEMQELLDLTGLTLSDFDKMGNSLDAWTGYIDNTYNSMAALEEEVKKLQDAITATEIHNALPKDQTSGTTVPSSNIYDRPMTSQTPIVPNTATERPNYGVNQSTGNKTTTTTNKSNRFVLYDPKEVYTDLWWEQLREQAAKVPVGKSGKRGKVFYAPPSGASKELQQLYSIISKEINKINGYAQGTSSAMGGLSLVGEKGRELRVLNKGDGIIPHNITENLMALGKIPSSYWTALLNSSINRNTNSQQQIINNNFDKIVLPNVTNGQQFVNELKNLPNMALQSSGRRI